MSDEGTSTNPLDKGAAVHENGAFVRRVTSPVESMSRGVRGAHVTHGIRGAKKQ